MVEQVFDGIKDFERLRRQFANEGACDSEPDRVFQGVLLEALNGKGPSVPRTGLGWELLTRSTDCEPAAKALHDQTLKIVQAIESCTIQDLELLRGRLHDYCWRFF